MTAKILVVTAVVVALGMGSATAQIRKDAKNQRQRIAQGVRSGELTRRETVNLARQQNQVRKEIREAKTNDGVITPGERREIRQDQRKASRNIYRKKHNNRDRN